MSVSKDFHSQNAKKEIEEKVLAEKFSLFYNYMGLEEIPEYLFLEKNRNTVCFLFLKNNLLKTVESNIGQLKNLIELYLHSNRIEFLPSEIGDLAYLECLDVSCNKLAAIPREIGKLKRLRRLGLSNNLLQSLPEEIGELEALETLEVMQNCLLEMPKSICRCHQLQNLMLNGNRLVSIPREISLLHKLVELSVSGNRLLYLPPFLGAKNESLKFVFADNNAFLHGIAIHLFGLEVGINRCGTQNLESGVHLSSRVIDSHLVEHVLVFPKEFAALGSESKPVVPLLEMALRTVYLSYGKDHLSSLPAHLNELLQCPSAACDACGHVMFLYCWHRAHEITLAPRGETFYGVSFYCSYRCYMLGDLR